MNIKCLLNKILKLGKKNNLYKINTKGLDFNFGNIQKDLPKELPKEDHFGKILANNAKRMSSEKVFDVKTGSYYNYSKTGLKI